MSEAKCICGHDHLWPDAVLGQQQFDDCCEEECECDTFRPVLPWPDAEGTWWCDNGWIYRVNSNLEIWDTYTFEWGSAQNEVSTLCEGWMSKDRWLAENGHWLDDAPTLHFTRLLEANPFEGK